eukprot:4478831-Heterocapsa_arctica.AAC.1
MTENPLFAQCYKTRCLQWFGITTPTDAHIVPDNYMTNRRRLGSYLAAHELLVVADAAAPVPVTGLVAAPLTTSKAKAPGASRPLSPPVGPRKSRRVDSDAGAGYGAGSAASSSWSSTYPYDAPHYRQGSSSRAAPRGTTTPAYFNSCEPMVPCGLSYLSRVRWAYAPDGRIAESLVASATD